MKKIIERIKKSFYLTCDSFSNGLHKKGWRYNDVGALALKLSLISICLFLIIIGLSLALILL